MGIILKYLIAGAVIIPIIIIPFALYVHKAKDDPGSGFYGYPNFNSWVGTIISVYLGLIIAIIYLKIRGY